MMVTFHILIKHSLCLIIALDCQEEAKTFSYKQILFIHLLYNPRIGTYAL